MTSSFLLLARARIQNKIVLGVGRQHRTQRNLILAILQCFIYFMLKIVLNNEYEVRSFVFIVNLSTSGINPWSIPGLGWLGR